VLWPPNGKLVPVQVTVSVTDPDGSGPAGSTLTSLTSNEGSIADEQQGFVVGTASTSGSLQASRAGTGSGRGAGGKAAGKAELATGHHAPETGPGARARGAGAGTASS
jgi:hypothetical protein